MNSVSSPVLIEASVFTRLPDSLRHTGEPNEWTRVSRPGMTIHSFLEGPSFGPDGLLWVADIPYGRLFSIDPEGNWTQQLQYEGYPHSTRQLGDGSFAIADHRNGLVRWRQGQGNIERWHDGVNLQRFKGLGDLCEAPNGDLWITDPGLSSMSDPTGAVYRLRKGAASPELVLNNVPYPNGIALSPDGKMVYVAATRANAVWRFMADGPNMLIPMVGVHVQLSGGLGPDGLAVNAQGYLAVAHAQAGRAWLLNPLGDVIARIDTPGGTWTTAVAFDPTGQKLFITEAQTGSIYVADLGAMIPARQHS